MFVVEDCLVVHEDDYCLGDDLEDGLSLTVGHLKIHGHQERLLQDHQEIYVVLHENKDSVQLHNVLLLNDERGQLVRTEGDLLHLVKIVREDLVGVGADLVEHLVAGALHFQVVLLSHHLVANNSADLSDSLLVSGEFRGDQHQQLGLDQEKVFVVVGLVLFQIEELLLELSEIIVHQSSLHSLQDEDHVLETHR